MGGGSVQIAVETNQSGEEDEFSQKINLGCDDNNDVFMYIFSFIFTESLYYFIFFSLILFV